MGVDGEIAARFEGQIDFAVAGDLVEQVIEERDAGVDFGAPRAVESEGDFDFGFARLAGDFRLARRGFGGRGHWLVAGSAARHFITPPPAAARGHGAVDDGLARVITRRLVIGDEFFGLRLAIAGIFRAVVQLSRLVVFRGT